MFATWTVIPPAGRRSGLTVGGTVILPHHPLPPVGVSTGEDEGVSAKCQNSRRRLVGPGEVITCGSRVAGPRVPSAAYSRRRDCHFADTPLSIPIETY